MDASACFYISYMETPKWKQGNTCLRSPEGRA